MTGGMAYLYDPEGVAHKMLNMDTLVTCPVSVEHWETQLKDLIERHAQETGSLKADNILQHWETELSNFVQICPKEMLVHLPHPLSKLPESIPAQ
jgi:glutamate synthase (NADPH/NADH) large chain